jgi:hypothetical protein
MGTTAKPSLPTRLEETLSSALRGTDLEGWHAILAPLLGTDRLDLVDLRRAGPLLALEVARTGRPVFERQPGMFRAFQALAARRYADTQKLRDAQRRAIRVFLAQHGLA